MFRTLCPLCKGLPPTHRNLQNMEAQSGQYEMILEHLIVTWKENGVKCMNDPTITEII